MILVDTSVWIDHLRRGEARLQRLLEEDEVLVHPFVVGELACGTLTDRSEILGLLDTLPRAVVADHAEVMRLVGDRRLHGKGLGWVDMHLLASSVLSEAGLWTLDRRLARAASAMGIRGGL